jgi:hypothetical protein
MQTGLASLANGSGIGLTISDNAWHHMAGTLRFKTGSNMMEQKGYLDSGLFDTKVFGTNDLLLD